MSSPKARRHRDPALASLFYVVADLGLLETQKIEATVYILWHIATYVRSWLQNSRNGVGLVEFDLGFLVCANLNRESVVTSEISSTSQSVLFHPNILRTPFNFLIVSFPDKQDIRLSCSFSYLLLTCDLSTILPQRLRRFAVPGIGLTP